MRRNGRDTRELTDRVKQYLSRSVQGRVGVAEVADVVGVSASYLAQAFRQSEHTSIYHYSLQLRLRRAASLLPIRDNLTQVALDLGFASHSHFSTTFLRWAGCTPSAYRARARAGWSGHDGHRADSVDHLLDAGQPDPISRAIEAVDLAASGARARMTQRRRRIRTRSNAVVTSATVGPDVHGLGRMSMKRKAGRRSVTPPEGRHRLIAREAARTLNHIGDGIPP
jgi:AraC-like DNA-binding protein